MKTITYTITYTNNQGLELKINKFTSGQFKWAFSLTFNNGVHTFCYTLTGLRTILLKNGMIRKWAANHYEKKIEWIASPGYTTSSTDTTEQTKDRHTIRLGKLRTKSLRTRQSHSSIIIKNGASGSQLFSHFSIKKFFTSKNFSYICDTNKRIRQ